MLSLLNYPFWDASVPAFRAELLWQTNPKRVFHTIIYPNKKNVKLHFIRFVRFLREEGTGKPSKTDKTRTKLFKTDKIHKKDWRDLDIFPLYRHSK